jgi:hypothetical protein
MAFNVKIICPYIGGLSIQILNSGVFMKVLRSLFFAVFSISLSQFSFGVEVAPASSAVERVAKSTREYLKIGGVANVRFVDNDHAIALANGTFSALTATVTSREPQRDGSTLVGMTHTFLTDTGGMLVTEDVIRLVPVPGRDGVVSITVDYKVVKCAGGLEGYEGQRFVSQGFIDGNQGIASVRYDGEISRIRR